MKKLFTPAVTFLMLVSLFVSCSKDGVEYIPKPVPGQEPKPNPNPQTPPDTTNKTFVIGLRTEIKVGNVMYDSIPSSLMIRSWDSAQQLSTSFHSLKAGSNELTLSRSKVKYELTVEKWGLSEKFIINAAEFQNGRLYKFSGTKPLKPLRSEITYILENGVYKADSKNSYIYNGNGSLSEIQYQRKKADGSPYLDVTDRFEYSGNRLQYMLRFKPDGEIIQHITFTYDNSGRVLTMKEVNQAGETNASVEYHNIAGREETNIHYTYSGKTITMNYYKVMVKGNLVQGNSITSHHNSELSIYDYDNNINPYHQMNWPDLFLSRQSKNNVTYEQTSYHGAYPINVPYGFTYGYDAEGYPKEVVKQYRTYLTGQHAYTAKTVFTY
jgi:hypothetical protein